MLIMRNKPKVKAFRALAVVLIKTLSLIMERYNYLITNQESMIEKI